jgi:hypothetical protein
MSLKACHQPFGRSRESWLSGRHKFVAGGPVHRISTDWSGCTSNEVQDSSNRPPLESSHKIVADSYVMAIKDLTGSKHLHLLEILRRRGCNDLIPSRN